MKKLILITITGILISGSIFANDLDSTRYNNSEKIDRIKYSIDSLIKSELGDVNIDPNLDEKSHSYANSAIRKKDITKYEGIQFNIIKKTNIDNDNIKIYDFPINHFIETIKTDLRSFEIKEWEFKKYSIVFGETDGVSYMVISMDY
jgi:hypothetical protein